MKPITYCLLVGIWAFYACSEKKSEDFSVKRDTVLVTAGVEKTKEGYMKALAGHWKVDTAGAHRELLLLIKAVGVKVAKETGDTALIPDGLKVFGFMAGQWIKQMGDWRLELREDGTRIYNENDPEPMVGKYGFNSALDTLYLLSKSGDINYRFKLKTVSPDSLSFLRFMPIQEGDKSTYLRYRYIRDK